MKPHVYIYIYMHTVWKQGIRTYIRIHGVDAPCSLFQFSGPFLPAQVLEQRRQQRKVALPFLTRWRQRRQADRNRKAVMISIQQPRKNGIVGGGLWIYGSIAHCQGMKLQTPSQGNFCIPNSLRKTWSGVSEILLGLPVVTWGAV